MEPNNQLLDALLQEAGISHAGMANRINQAAAVTKHPTRYDHTAVGRWIRGQRPRGHVPDIICGILAERLNRPVDFDDIGMGTPGAVPASGVELDQFVARATVLWRSDHQHRMDTQRTTPVEGTAAILPVWEWENPPDDRDVSRPGVPRVGHSDVELLRSARSHYETMYRQAGGVAARPRVARFLNDQAAPLLRGAYTDETGRELMRAIGGLVAVAGICAYDADAQGLAQRYYHQALRLAKASGDRAFGGYVIALLVNQAVYRRQYRQAVGFAEAALRSAGPHISPGLATDLHAMQGKAFARLGDQAGAHRCMKLAEAAADRIRPDDEPAETGYVQPGLAAAHAAETLMSLGDLRPARDYALAAAAFAAHPRGQVHRLATLTTVDLRRGEADQAAATAVKMVRHAQGQESHRLRDRLTSVRTALAKAGARDAAIAVEMIDDTLRIPL